jgi:hypothetical protein
MAAKKSTHSKNRATTGKAGKKRRKAKLNVTAEEARKAPVRIYTGDNDDTADLEVQR